MTVYVQLIPAMTSDTAPAGYVASASSVFGAAAAWKAFDQGGPSDFWNSNTGVTWWLEIELPFAVRIVMYGILGNQTYYRPKNFELQGWNGASWDTLDSQTDQTSTANQEFRYILGIPATYAKYRLYITATQDAAGYAAVDQFNLYGEVFTVDPNKVLTSSEIAPGNWDANSVTSANLIVGANAGLSNGIVGAWQVSNITAANLLEGVVAGNNGTIVGTFNEAARNTGTGAANILLGSSITIANSVTNGSFNEASRNVGTGAANIVVGSSITIQNSPIVGTFNEAARNTGTTANNIANGITIKIQNATTTGTATLETHTANQIIDTAGGLWSTANVIATNLRIGYTAGANNTILGTLVPGSGSNAPNAPTINVTDARNGATANIAVTGADAGTINRVYSAPIDGGVWTLRANITGNGTAQANLAVDSYAWVAISDSGTGNTVSNPDFAAINPILVYTRTNRKVETAARNFVRKCKRGWGVQVWWINGRDDDGRELYAMRGKFSRGIGLTGVDLDIERATFFVPRQYDGAGGLLFPVVTSNTVEDVTPQSRLYYAGKTYEVQLVTGDVEGMPETAVFRCECIRRMYNPFVQDFTPPYSNLTPEESAMATIWETITANTTATVNRGYFIDTTSNAVTLTLPAAPTLGWSCWVNVLNRTNLTTITASGGLTIMGTDSVTIDYDNVGFQVVYSPSSNGWRIVTEV